MLCPARLGLLGLFVLRLCPVHRAFSPSSSPPQPMCATTLTGQEPEALSRQASRLPLSQPPPLRTCAQLMERRGLLKDGLLLLGGAVGLGLPAAALTRPSSASAATGAAAPHTVDYTAFQKKLFQKTPGLLAYPAWMEGEWQVGCKFIGADFPSSATKASPYVPKDRIVTDTGLPGFRRLSIAMVPDVGKDHAFRMRFVSKDGGRVEEDKPYNLKQALESELGKAAVTTIEYNPDKNPNRASLNLLPGASPNAQRIELFWNARSVLPSPPEPDGSSSSSSFRFVEDIRQVSLTPQLAETSTVGDYRHLWEFYSAGPGSIKAYLSTVAYATPQDPLFQTSGLQPLVVYFHVLTMQRAAAAAPVVEV